MTPRLRNIRRILNDEFRVRLYTALLQDEFSLDGLTALFNCDESSITEHLEQLDDAGLISSKQLGRRTYYQAQSNPVEEVCSRVIEENTWGSLNHRIRKLKRHSVIPPENERITA